MSYFLHVLRQLISAPVELFGGLFGTEGEVGRSPRSRALLMGMPALILAFTGMGLLAMAELGMADSLESRYQGLVEQAISRQQELKSELSKELRLLQTGNIDFDAQPNDLIPPDDPRRIALREAEEEQRVFLQKLADLNPDEPEYLLDLAKISLSHNEVARGMAMLRRIAPMDKPGFVDAHLFLANLFLRQRVSSSGAAEQNVRRALIHAEHALARDPDNLVAMNFKALILMKSNNVDDLPVAYRLYERLFEQDSRAYPFLLEINERLGRADERNGAVLRKAIDRLLKERSNLEPGSPERNSRLERLCECYQRQENYAAAESLLNDELAKLEKSDRSNRATVERLLGRVYLAWTSMIEGDDREAEQQRLERLAVAYELDSSNAAVLRQLTRLGDSSDAEIATAARKIYSARDDPNPPAAVHNELGIQALSRSDYQGALKNFNRAYQISADSGQRSPEILNNLAYSYLKVDEPNPRMALNLIDKALRETPAKMQAQYESNFRDTRARALLQLGRIEPAIADFRRAHKGRPENVGIIEALIACYRENEMQAEMEIWQDKLEALTGKRASPAEEASDGDDSPSR